MKIVTALLCDKAHARDGLLYVIGGGITRVWRAEYPAPAGVELALMIELHRTEAKRPHQIDIELVGEDGAVLFELGGAFQTAADHLKAWDTQLVPFVVNLAGVPLTDVGPYNLEISIDGNHQSTIRFTAEVVVDQARLDLDDGE